MADKMKRAARRPPETTQSPGGRRLIAGLRVTQLDEDVLAIVRPYLTDVSSEGDLAHRLWRRGLEISLAEVVSVGAPVPQGITEELLASLVAQRLLPCLPLLRRTGTLALLGLDAAAQERPIQAEPHHPGNPAPADTIDTGAADAITALCGSDFL